jgi:hypothetical protein
MRRPPWAIHDRRGGTRWNTRAVRSILCVTYRGKARVDDVLRPARKPGAILGEHASARPPGSSWSREKLEVIMRWLRMVERVRCRREPWAARWSAPRASRRIRRIRGRRGVASRPLHERCIPAARERPLASYRRGCEVTWREEALNATESISLFWMEQAEASHAM